MTTEMQVVVEKARAFHSDIECGAPEIGGPPGYDSPAWQRRMMRMGDYYRIVAGGAVVGGLIVFRKAPREYELGRIFVDPDLQNRGIGAQAMAFLWRAYPLAKRWTLDTPAWNVRTRHFYKKVGFHEVAIRDGAVLFERRTPARAPRRQAASGKEGV
jgi:GNAT superfamily N-acetyltransferase